MDGKDRIGFIGKEKDVETSMDINFEGNLADHGVFKLPHHPNTPRLHSRRSSQD